VLLPFVLWKFPQWYAASWDKLTDPKDIAKLESDTRTAMVQALGGIALLTGLLLTWRNLRMTEQNSRHTLDLSRKGQINDRFIKAIEQLGAVDQGGGKKLEIRLGGIYALEQVAKDSPDDHHWPIMEILTAYIREHAPWKETEQRSKEGSSTETPPTQNHESLPKPTTDVQAILTVVGRRTRTYGKGEVQQLDLGNTDLRGVWLPGAHLEGAFLAGAHLEGANLPRAHLEGADLLKAHLEGAFPWQTHLEGAILAEAHLEGARFGGAHLDGALLVGAHLEKADLAGAELKRAILYETHLEGAILWQARLEGANLSRAYLEGADLSGAHLEGADLSGAHLEGANLTGAHLEGADLSEAHLEGAILWQARLRGAKSLTVEQLSTVKTLSNAHLDPPFQEQIQQQYPHLLEEY
jgi:uncharacterized protein YjbI with pentapeptide repeats